MVVRSVASWRLASSGCVAHLGCNADVVGACTECGKCFGFLRDSLAHFYLPVEKNPAVFRAGGDVLLGYL